MLNVLKYLAKGLLHYINSLFYFIDFYDKSIMILIFVVLLICFIKSFDFRYSIVSFLKTLKNVIKNIAGLILLMIFVLYYIYVLFYFENEISPLLILFTLYLIFKDFIDTNLNLLVNSKKDTIESIKDVSFAVLLIFLQQLSSMAEVNNFNNIKYVLLSLMMIPIYTIIFSIIKMLTTYDAYYRKNKKRINIDDFDFFRLYIYCLFRVNNFKIVHEHFDNILKNDYRNYMEYKNELRKEIAFNNFKEKNYIEKAKIKITSLKNIFWLINILIIIYYIICK